MEDSTNIFKKMLNFDTMITPTIIKILYFVFTTIYILVGVGIIIAGLNSYAGGGFQVFMGLIVIVVSPFLTRIWCEIMIVIFKINENLSKLANQKDA